MHTQSLTQFDPSRFFQPPTTDPRAGRTITAQVGAIQTSTDFSGKVSVMTAEGDKVTFSLDAETDFRYANYQYKAQSDDQSLEVTGKYAESSTSQTLGLTVEGDLNDQEVADLTKLFAKVTNIFRKFFNGQDEQAVAKTAKLADRFGSYSTLAGLDLSMDVTRSVTMLAAQLATQQAGEPTALPSSPAEGTAGSSTTQQDNQDGAPTAGAAIPPPSADTTALASTPAASTTEAVVTPDAAPSTATAIPSPSSGITAPTQPAVSASEPSQPSSLVQQVLDAIQEARVEPRKLNKYFVRFLEDLGKALKNGKQDEKKAEGSQTSQSPNVPAQTGSKAFLAYQSTSQSSMMLSVHT